MKQSGRKSKSNSVSSEHNSDIENMNLHHDKLNEKHRIISTQIQHEITRQLNNQEKIKALKDRVQALKAQKIRKQQKLQMLQKQTNAIKNKKQFESESLKMLKEHILHLRERLKLNLHESDFEDDDIDVDNMTYQELLQLGDKVGKVSKGISGAQFSTLNKLPYSAQCGENTCLICQDELQVNIECIKLKCSHLFHVECLKQWLEKEKICPLCKTEVL